MKEKIKAYFNQKSTRKWLVIFDNIDDIRIWNINNIINIILIDFLSESEQGYILFTIHSYKVAVKLASFYMIIVTKPNIEIFIQILENLLVEKILFNNYIIILSLLKQLVFLSLAITRMVIYINKNSISLSDYLQLLQDQEPHVIELLSKDFRDEIYYKNIQNPVTLTWFIFFQ